MRTKVLCDRSAWVFARAFWIILLVEVMNEFVVAPVLHRMGLDFGSHEIHFAKTIVVLAAAVPILSSFLFRDHRRLQRQRKISEQMQEDYHQLFDASPDGVCVMDIDGKFVHANKAFSSFVGYDVQTLRQLSGHPFLTAKNKDEILGKFKLAKSGSSVHFHTTLADKKGVEHPLEVIYVPKFQGIEVVGVHIVLKDITEIIDTTTKLEETQKYLDSLIRNTSDAIMIFKPDTVVARINKAFESMFEWKEEELVGNPIPTRLFGEYVDEARAIVQRVSMDQVVANQETRRFTKSGQPIDVSLTVSPIKNESGEIVAIAGVSRDISLQKQVVRKLQRTTNILNSLFLYAGDAILLVDVNGCILSANPAWLTLFGWQYEPLKGRPYYSIFGEQESLERILRGEVFVAKERRVTKRDGIAVYVGITASPMYDDDSHEITGAILIYRDLTNQKQAEASLLRSEKMAVIGQLAAGIAHEIRNPLTAIKGFLQMTEPSEFPHLDILLSEVERISDITNELLLLAKPQASSMRTENAAMILDEVIAFMRTEANMFSISIEAQYENRHIQINCVRNQIKQVLINLIKNAIEALPNGGRIQVHLREVEDDIEMAIVDNGMGIPEDKIPILGQPFYTTKERGSGLGLMVSYRIVANHNGRIHVASEDGKGSIFEVILPRVRTAVGALSGNTLGNKSE